MQLSLFSPEVYQNTRKFVHLSIYILYHTMKRTFLSTLLATVSCGCLLAATPNETEPAKARFDLFSYTGNDAYYTLPEGFDPRLNYINPILSGTYPDPSICRKGNDYYMVNSSFCYFPGIPVWHSTDLVNWKQIGYALDRPSQLSIKDGMGTNAGIYAPDIKYNPHNDTFYLIVTDIGGKGNIIVKSKDPAQGWSEPIRVREVGGIDPSFLFDTDGKCYIVNNQSPAYPPEYDGHCAIWIREYDTETDRVCSLATVLVDKGVHPEERPIWIEGPHLYHIGDTYYLMAAEGGTGPQHSEVIFSSDKPTGPFTPCPINPILTQRDLPADREFPITCTGHADLVETPEGKWWAVFLGVLPYDGHHDNTGRNTFLLPVEWNEEQPIILPQGERVATFGEKENLATGQLLTGNFSYTDNFDTHQPDMKWITLRTPKSIWWEQADGVMKLTPRPCTLAEKKQPSFLCRWVKHANYTASTRLDFTPQKAGELAGLAVFQDEKGHYVVGKRMNTQGECEVVVIRSDKEGSRVVARQLLGAKWQKKAIWLQIESKGSSYTFAYSRNGKKWHTLGTPQEGHIITTQYAGGFTGSSIGLYATTAETSR